MKGLPDFADNRMLGIEQLRKVQEEGIFLGPAATFALTYTWLEEGALKRATGSALRNHNLYPDNVINNLMLGRLYMYRRAYTESFKYFPQKYWKFHQNRRVHYYLTRMYLRQKAAHAGRAARKHLLSNLILRIPTARLLFTKSV